MKRITSVIILFLITMSTMHAQLHTLPSCNTTGSNLYGPMYTTSIANSTSRTAVIYPSSQLVTIAGEVLTGLYFSRATTGLTLTGTPTFKIYVKETPATDFGEGALDWATAITGATLVYDSNPATIVGTALGWKLFPMSTNFTYSGTQNLAVFFEYTNTSLSNAFQWNFESLSPCVDTSNLNTTKYFNNTTGNLPASLTMSDYRRPYIGFDFVVSCIAPVSVSISNVTLDSAAISWVESAPLPTNGYEYYLSTSNVAPVPSTPATDGVLTGTSVTVNGLPSNTTHYVWVRSVCDAGDKSVWKAAAPFKTLCESITDFVETFDGISPVGTGILPDCWSKLGTSINGHVVAGSVAPLSPSNRLYLNVVASTSVYVVMPPVSNLQAATHRLRFKAFSTVASSALRVGYFTNPSDLSTFVQIGAQPFSIPGTNVASTQDFTLIPPALPVGVNQLVFTTATDAATTIYIDDVKWEINSPCVEPTQLTATSITNTSALLNWVAGSTTTWEVQYGIQHFVLGTGITETAINGHVLDELLPNTTYQYYVRGVCADSSVSSWAGPFTFKTQCNDATAFTENFDGLTTNFSTTMPDCWGRGLVGSPTIYVTTGSLAPFSPGNRLYMIGNPTTSPASVAFAILPSLSNLQAGTHRLRFKAYALVSNRPIQIGYVTDTSDMSTFVQLEEILLPGTAQASAIEFQIIPGILPVGVKHLAIRNAGYTEGSGASTTAYFDDFSWEVIPTCIEPSALTATQITNSSAVLGWTEAASATSWEIEYGAPGFTPGTGTIVPAPTNPFTLTGLSANTNYVYYVRAVCSVDDSSNWAGSVAFKTQCDAITDFSENFDSLTSNFSSTMPDCWGRGLIGSPSLYVASGSAFPMSPSNRLYMVANSTLTPPSEALAILPPVSNLQANTHRLRFTAFATGPDRFIEIGYLTDPTDLNTYTSFETIVLPGTVVANAQRFIVIPGVLPAGVKNLVIKNPGFPGSSSTTYIDDVVWEAIPSCVEPTSVTVNGVLGTSAIVSWVAATPAPASGYEYYYSTSNVVPGAIPDVVGGTLGSVAAGVTTANLPGLSPSTPYFVWVRSVCSVTDKSDWTLAATFTTTCLTIAPNYTQDFAVFTPSCWSKYVSGTIATGPTGPANTGSWNADGYLNVGTVGAARINIFSFAPAGSGWLISPVFDLTGGGFQVKYDIGATQFNSTAPITGGVMGTDDFLYALMSTDAGVTWTILETFSATNTPSHLGATKTYEIPTVTSSTVKFAFYGTSGTVNDLGISGDYFIDNFVVEPFLSVGGFDSENFSYYPNPVTDVLTMSYINTISEVVVYNLLGQQVLTSKPNATQTQVDISGLNAGTYMVKITSDVLTKTIKVVKN